MTLLAISHYRGGTIDEVTPLAKTLKAVYLKYGLPISWVVFKPAQMWETGSLPYSTPIRRPMRRRKQLFAQDPEYQKVVTEIAKIAKRINRELVIGLDL
jgi:hypothetical protein